MLQLDHTDLRRIMKTPAELLNELVSNLLNEVKVIKDEFNAAIVVVNKNNATMEKTLFDMNQIAYTHSLAIKQLQQEIQSWEIKDNEIN